MRRTVDTRASACAVSVVSAYLAVPRSTVTYLVFFIDLIASRRICNYIQIISSYETSGLPVLIALVHALGEGGFYLLGHGLLAEPVECSTVSVKGTWFPDIDGRR